ncbi:MAG: hypothetical protein JW797_14805 [Bradymonadales bacterium]|nr:hypothetical protein [Bradymonadales bacterium]
MNQDPFATTNLLTLGGQIAQVWQRTLEAWWRALLNDPNRLAELAGELGRLHPTRSKDNRTPSLDLAPLVRALELIEQRIQAIETRIASSAGQPTADPPFDPAKLATAIESLDGRLKTVEAQIRVLADTVTRLFEHLQDPDGTGQGTPGSSPTDR